MVSPPERNGRGVGRRVVLAVAREKKRHTNHEAVERVPTAAYVECNDNQATLLVDLI